MAGFNSNTCTYPNCGRKYSKLNDLIYHIEDEHIDFSSETLSAMEDSQPTYVPMSYVLKFSTLYPRENIPEFPTGHLRLEEQVVNIESETSSTGSNDSNSNYQKDLNDLSNQFREDPSSIKRFICLKPSCHKRYKTINGIKYHIKNCHEKERLEPKKYYKCHCGKSYKSHPSLRAHKMVHEAPRALSRTISEIIGNARGRFFERSRLPSFQGTFCKNTLIFNESEFKRSDPFIFQRSKNLPSEAGPSKRDNYQNDPYLG